MSNDNHPAGMPSSDAASPFKASAVSIANGAGNGPVTPVENPSIDVTPVENASINANTVPAANGTRQGSTTPAQKGLKDASATETQKSSNPASSMDARTTSAGNGTQRESVTSVENASIDNANPTTLTEKPSSNTSAKTSTVFAANGARNGSITSVENASIDDASPTTLTQKPSSNAAASAKASTVFAANGARNGSRSSVENASIDVGPQSSTPALVPSAFTGTVQTPASQNGTVIPMPINKSLPQSRTAPAAGPAIASTHHLPSPRYSGLRRISPARAPFVLQSPGRSARGSPSDANIHRCPDSTVTRSVIHVGSSSTSPPVPTTAANTSSITPARPATATNAQVPNPSTDGNNGDLPRVPRRRYPIVPASAENRSHNPAAFGVDGAVVSYAVAENMASEIMHTQDSRPSFTSSYARVELDQQRPLCDRTGLKRQRLRGAHLDDTRLGTEHEWATTIVESMGLTRYVLTPDIFNRRDMQRLRMLYDKDPTSAREIWSRKRLQREWFEIPGTLLCDRTFARDPMECYYIAAMDELLKTGAVEEAMNNPPLLQDPLLPRWWTAFRLRCDWYRESWYRHTIHVLVPHDDLEVQQWDPTTLMDEYPEVPLAYKTLNIPPGIPVPTPPVVWYYHYEIMRGAQDSPRTEILRKSVFREILYLTIASWYNEFTHGDRMFILEQNTIEQMRYLVGERNVVRGVHTAEIFRQMAIARSIAPDLWNEMRFSDENFPVSYFVDSVRGHVATNMTEIGGRVISVSTRSRKIYDDLRQTRRLERRNSAILPLQMFQNDIALVPGLLDIARDQNWMLQRGLTVQGVLANLVQKIADQQTELQYWRSQSNQPFAQDQPASPDGPAF